MSTRNRVWDTNAGAFVSWQTPSPDPTGIEYPGPGTFGVDTSDFCVLRDTRQQVPEDAEVLTPVGSPASLWTFDGSLDDVSGNARNLSVTAGNELYGPGPSPDVQALFCDGASLFSVTDAAFAALGDVTIEALINPQTFHSASAFIATYAGSGETSVDNAHYSLRLVADNFMSIFHESGAGVDETADASYVVPAFEWSHVACVRDGLDDKLYVNGQLVLTTAGLAPPTDGSNNDFVVGDYPGATDPFTGFVSSLRVYPGTVRTEAQLLEAAQKALPLVVLP